MRKAVRGAWQDFEVESSSMTLIDGSLVETLLHMSEGDTLDFSESSTSWRMPPQEQKGELVKDILAFATHGRRPSLHLVGVAENRVVGRKLLAS